jgi:hypothetical protein
MNHYSQNVEWMEEWKVKSLVTKYIPPEGWTEGFPISITGFNSEDGLGTKEFNNI